MWTLLASLATSPALACEGPTHRTSCHLDEREEDNDDDDKDRSGGLIDNLDLRLAGESTALPHTTAWGLSARVSGRRDSWLGVEGRWTDDGRWTSRASTGFDLLGRSKWDLRAGLFIGNVGVWQSEQERTLMIGTELAAGVTLGRVYGEVRFLGGKRPNEAGVRTETTVAVGYRLVEELRIEGHWLGLNAGGGERSGGVGLGMSWTF